MNIKKIGAYFDIETEGYKYLGRGPEATGPHLGWERREDLYFRCIKCGSMMHSLMNDYYRCNCGAMYVDADYHRFGSKFGDQNVLVYKKMK